MFVLTLRFEFLDKISFSQSYDKWLIKIHYFVSYSDDLVFPSSHRQSNQSYVTHRSRSLSTISFSADQLTNHSLTSHELTNCIQSILLTAFLRKHYRIASSYEWVTRRKRFFFFTGWVWDYVVETLYIYIFFFLLLFIFLLERFFSLPLLPQSLPCFAK